MNTMKILLKSVLRTKAGLLRQAKLPIAKRQSGLDDATIKKLLKQNATQERECRQSLGLDP